MEFIDNKNGTYTLKWNVFSNGENYDSWGGKETGEVNEVTFKPEELTYINYETNKICFGYSKLVYNILPSEVVYIGCKLKELLLNAVSIEPSLFEYRKMRNLLINIDNVILYINGVAESPDIKGSTKMSAIFFKGFDELILSSVETEYFSNIFKRYKKEREKEQG